MDILFSTFLGTDSVFQEDQLLSEKPTLFFFIIDVTVPLFRGQTEINRPSGLINGLSIQSKVVTIRKVAR